MGKDEETNVGGCIGDGERCLGDGDGCQKCKDADGISGCCPGTEAVGCGAFQTPMCKKIKTIEQEKI